MKTANSCFLLVVFTSGITGVAQADTPALPWFLHVGAAHIDTDEAAKVRVFDAPVPGADVRLAPRYTAAVDLGRFFTPHVAVSVSAGLPLKQPIDAAGSIQPYGRLGRITYGPAAATLQWHPLPNAAVQPYVGAGVSYMHVFASRDATVHDFHVSDDVGPVVQGGFEVPLGHGLGLFADVKKGWLHANATGSLAGAPVDARIRLDPLIVHTGLAIRF